MKPKGNEFYFLVSELTVPRNEVSKTLPKSIEQFIDMVPEIADGLKEFLSQDKMLLFITSLDYLNRLLAEIHARWLEVDSARILTCAKVGNKEMCESLLPNFISNLFTLSINLQMAQHKALSNITKQYSQIEDYIKIVNNISAVRKLVQNSDFEKAEEIANHHADELKTSSMGIELMAKLKEEAQEESDSLAKNIIDIYSRKIVVITGSENAVLKKILAVDDKPEILTTISRMLKGHYQTFAATTGNAAIRLIEKQKMELFILDIEMPVMDGFELAEYIRARREHKTTPILFLTGTSTREYVTRAMKYGYSDFIVKPADKNMLIAKISAHLGS